MRFQLDDGSFSDWRELHALMVSAFAPQDAAIDPPSSHLLMGPEELKEKAVSEDLFLADDPLSGCLFGRVEGNAYYLGKWAVSPAAQGKGIGGRLLELAEARAMSLGIYRLELGTRIELTKNHRQFRALGFRAVSAYRHPGFSRATALIFEKSLQLQQSN